MAKKKIVVLTTGGTIAGVGESGKDTGYVSGQISGGNLVASVPELAEYADVRVEEICNINSDDMTDRIWIALANRVKELQEDEPVDGIVITHGTDTMDETAYFLSLTVKCEKPVIFTGSMKPATAKNPDGPANLLGAVRVAAGFAVDDDPPENYVWVYFAGELFDAKRVQKCSASALNAMGVDLAGEGACMDALREKNFFDVSKLESLPRVNVVYFLVKLLCGCGFGRVQQGVGGGACGHRYPGGRCQPDESRDCYAQRDACSRADMCGHACPAEGRRAPAAVPDGDGEPAGYQEVLCECVNVRAAGILKPAGILKREPKHSRFLKPAGVLKRKNTARISKPAGVLKQELVPCAYLEM